MEDRFIIQRVDGQYETQKSEYIDSPENWSYDLNEAYIWQMEELANEEMIDCMSRGMEVRMIALENKEPKMEKSSGKYHQENDDGSITFSFSNVEKTSLSVKHPNTLDRILVLAEELTNYEKSFLRGLL